ncbi:extracellular solute-binding protein [Gracilibacillus oryzae]|uniref:Extracellular solute-binding protein n=1 Tax=Gracilibacillus oryzae TaxID=1672701 RepID=A0A7C8GRF5_9BACI|nr:extracellular solute-binding protein [Gracilibacillus oryzae]KAB8127493.1 extracellular solute-binding protein [Gracilibacillus oryzae]
MKLRKGLLAATSAVLLLSACSNAEGSGGESTAETANTDNVSKTGMPIVNEQIKLEIFADRAASTNEDWNDVMIFNEYEEMTNIDVEWEMVPTDALEEKRNLALASGTLPDVFHSADLSNLDLLKYGQQGVFIELNDLIDQYAPNLKKLMEENPDIKKGLTFPNGKIYSMPTIYSPDFTSVLIGSRPWINQDWLEQLGMENPQTTEEFYQYLKAVQETDLNGNGKNDEIPYGGTVIGGLVGWMKGAYGLGNLGTRHKYVDLDPENNEQLRFYPAEEEYKQMLQFINKLYSEGLIQQNIYTIDYNQFLANGSENIYGSTVLTNPRTSFGDTGEQFVGANALEGENGEKMFVDIGSSLVRLGGFAITKENPNPAATVRWMDHFYSDEGAKLFFMGKEGVTYEETEDGEIQYLDSITNSPDGLTMEQELAKHLTWLGGGYPGIVKKDYFQGAESLPSAIEAADRLDPYLPEQLVPAFTFTEEESRRFSALAADIEKYVQETQDKLITGEISFAEWDNYIQTLNDMGLEEYMEIQNAAFERYKNS